MKGVFKHSLAYMTVDLINKSIPFLLLPYLAKELNVNDYGMVELFNAYVGLLVLFLMMGVDGWCTAHYFRLKKNEFSKLLSIGLFFVIAACLLSQGIFALFVDDVGIMAAPIYVGAMCMLQVRALLFRLAMRPYRGALFLLCNILFSTLLTIALFELVAASYENRIFSLVVVSAMMGIASIYSIAKEFRSGSQKVSIEDIVKYWKFALPLLPNGLINYVRFGADRLVVANIYGVTQLAIFSVGYQLAMVVNIFMLSVNQSLMPFYMRSLAGADLRLYLKYCFATIVLVSVAAAFTFGLSPYILNLFFDQKYSESLAIARRYLIGYPFVIVAIAAGNYLHFNGRTGIILLITIISSGFHAGLLWLFYMNDVAVEGVANAFVLSAAVSALIGVIAAVKIRFSRQGRRMV